MQDFKDKKILLGVCGGVAAYKAAYLVREFTRLGATVRVVMTQAAQKFVTPMLFQALSGHEVRTELFDTQAERAMGHIELARWADYLLICPASANFIAKMAHGIADDLLSTLYLVANIPVLICPAMNHSMWAHAATQENCAQLRARGVVIIEPAVGSQACGEFGLGRLEEQEVIINALRLAKVKQTLVGKKVIITAGPTQEAIDPVRYIANHSSGKMGYALAAAAAAAGAEVVLISGPVQQQIPAAINLIRVTTAKEMYDAVMGNLDAGSIFIGAAAVADYRIKKTTDKKIKKDQEELTLELVKNPDILSAVAQSRKASLVVGFAAETQDVLQYAREKLLRKQVDMIIANQVGNGFGFAVDDNEVQIITASTQRALPLMHKTRLAGEIIAILAESLHNGSPL
ncbi:MAG: bifunctional 4'-phosphopantothenoylcysteine decarboxylase/phosphopantothenoylcysteine synthetase [Legionella sp. 40-6]|nr:bifunctional phosphopantothenoylcysteine decarboxylase/phosphopantothenate--cysteine ligase CoaBC [Legionella sp.]OJY32014.1 MAG: bifunctional 4'-phosphopantothenoylcysteine decarboxylase/phosphopantothenoylcysteine synthetase [Legionella sp. 40-6]